MGYTFKLGEEKEVGVELSSTDGTPFSTAGTYKYIDKDGNELTSGPAQVDGKKVFTLLKPTQAGTYHKVIFVCSNTPLDDQGQPDQSKNVETIMPSVPITVFPY